MVEIAADDILIHEKIGDGAFASVYRGSCRQKDVAVKLLHVSFSFCCSLQKTK
jgi:serine/threonine protein kinase